MIHYLNPAMAVLSTCVVGLSGAALVSSPPARLASTRALYCVTLGIGAIGIFAALAYSP